MLLIYFAVVVLLYFQLWFTQKWNRSTSLLYCSISPTAWTPGCVQRCDHMTTWRKHLFVRKYKIQQARNSLLLCFVFVVRIRDFYHWGDAYTTDYRCHLDKVIHSEYSLRMHGRNATKILSCNIVYKNKSKYPPRLLFEHLGSGSTLKHRCGTEMYPGQSKSGNLVKMPGLENEALWSSDQI